MSLSLLVPAWPTKQDMAVADLCVFHLNNDTVASSRVLSCFGALSRYLLSTPGCKQHSELVALGFWLREANIRSLLPPDSANHIIKPLGLVVHFTPANVDTMFVYSWACSVLMGNRNIVRLPSQLSDLQLILLEALNHIFAQPEFTHIGQQNLFVQVDRGSDEIQAISQAADGRILWGGDTSVQAIRALPSAPRCRDISFADRYSACVVQGDALSPQSLHDVAARVWRDMAAFEQQACSSPRILFWLGDRQQQSEFFTELGIVSGSKGMPVYQRNEQLVYCQRLMASHSASGFQFFQQLAVVTLFKWDIALINAHPGQQVLLLINIEQLDEVASNTDAKLQTLSYAGLEKEALIKFLHNPSIQGIDRAVPAGEALAFSPQWDGYDLFSQLTRRVVIK